MSTVCARRKLGFALLVAGSSTGSAACSGAQTADPCSLLSANEALPYVGSLVAPPYRTSDGAPDIRGDQCMYRGKDGRQITVAPDWNGGGATAGSSVQGAAGLMGGAPAKRPWERASWIPGGSLLASKGTRSVQIDVSAASGKEADAIALAKIIVPRFGHPLSYDGTKAVGLAPKPHAHPANACDFISRADVEAAVGPLVAAPRSDSPETSCTYRVATPKGERDFVVEFVWQGGYKSYAMAGGRAPGASSTVGFRTDTTLTGPWENAALLHGTQLIAVRHDVFVGMGLESADYEKAKALLAAICSRL